MKTKLLISIIALGFLTACQDDDNITPNQLVIDALHNKYPSADNVEWENEKSYITASFWQEQLSHTAWFDNYGQWHMTEIELIQKEKLPEAVRTAFENSTYNNGRIDDIDLLERLDAENIYIIEVKQDGKEYHLCYSEDGVLVKTIEGDMNDDYEDYLPTDPTPSEMTEFIQNRYPNARIVEIDIERNHIEVDIIHEQRGKELIFNAQKEWTHTHYDVLQTEIETVVLETLKQSEYKDYHIDEIEKYETPDGDYYLFELEKGKEVRIKIDTNGNLLNS